MPGRLLFQELDNSGKPVRSVYSKGRKKTNRKTKGSMKKTTRKGAYNPYRKKQMIKRRAPFVETKSKTYEDLQIEYPHLLDHLSFSERTTESRFMNPEVFLIHQQGIDEHQVIGRSIYAKYLNMKLTFRFPQSAFTISGQNQIVPLMPQTYELIWDGCLTHYKQQDRPRLLHPV